VIRTLQPTAPGAVGFPVGCPANMGKTTIGLLPNHLLLWYNIKDACANGSVVRGKEEKPHEI
jgi:hypothetical protein